VAKFAVFNGVDNRFNLILNFDFMGAVQALYDSAQPVAGFVNDGGCGNGDVAAGDNKTGLDGGSQGIQYGPLMPRVLKVI